MVGLAESSVLLSLFRSAQTARGRYRRTAGAGADERPLWRRLHWPYSARSRRKSGGSPQATRGCHRRMLGDSTLQRHRGGNFAGRVPRDCAGNRADRGSPQTAGGRHRRFSKTNHFLNYVAAAVKNCFSVHETDRETGIEPATSSLGIFVGIENTTPAVHGGQLSINQISNFPNSIFKPPLNGVEGRIDSFVSILARLEARRPPWKFGPAQM
jgi:hypothetical protein